MAQSPCHWSATKRSFRLSRCELQRLCNIVRYRLARLDWRVTRLVERNASTNVLRVYWAVRRFSLSGHSVMCRFLGALLLGTRHVIQISLFCHIALYAACVSEQSLETFRLQAHWSGQLQNLNMRQPA